MKTINENKFRTLSNEQLNETLGGYYIIITMGNGQKIRIKMT